MACLTFLHAADLHLDSPLRGLDRDAPSGQIRRATRDALVNMVDFSRGQKVKFVLLAGDLYDGDWTDWRTGQFLVQQLGRLVRDRIEVIAISGMDQAAPTAVSVGQRVGRGGVGGAGRYRQARKTPS